MKKLLILSCLTPFIIRAADSPTPTQYALQEQLYQALSPTYPAAISSSEAATIATACISDALPAKGIPNPTYVSFQAALITEFKSDKVLNWAANQKALTADANQIAIYFFGATSAQLASAIYDALVAASVNKTLAGNEEYVLATQCSSATDTTTLYTQLNTALEGDANLATLTVAQRAAVSFSAAQAVYPPTTTQAKSPTASSSGGTNGIAGTPPSYLPSKIFDISAGIVTLSPFTVDPTTHKLINDSPQTRGFVAATFKCRPAWYDTNFPSGLPYGHWINLEFHFGYAFGGNGGTTATVAPGSGDLLGDGSFGVNLYQQNIKMPGSSNMADFTIGPEMFAGFQTDSGNSQVLADYGFGLALSGAIQVESDQTAPKLEFMIRGGYAQVDSMTVNNDIVSVDGAGNPLFDLKGGMQVQAELRYPLQFGDGQYGYVSVGSTLYEISENGQATWSFFAGYTIGFDKLTSTIGSLLPKF